MFRNLPVAVKNIIIINALIMLATVFKESVMVENFALFFPASPYFRLWQPLTHMFMHGGIMHLFFNMYTLMIFGSVLERVWGAKKFLIFYFVTGLGAAAVHMGVQWIQYSSALSTYGFSPDQVAIWASEMASKGYAYVPDGFSALQKVLFTPTVGASGAIYGVLMGYAMLYPDSVMTLIFPPVSLKAKWFVLIFAGIELLLGISASNSGIAHFAHLGGLIFGFLLILYWKKTHRLYSNF